MDGKCVQETVELKKRAGVGGSLGPALQSVDENLDFALFTE
jgi:hypothetical protein